MLIMSDALYIQIPFGKNNPAIIHWRKCSGHIFGVISRFFPEKLGTEYVIIDSPCLEEYSWSQFCLPFGIIHNEFSNT